MNILIITPSFNQLDYIKRAIASVRDQVGYGIRDYDLGVKESFKLKPQHLTHGSQPITIHHHVQDGGSTDGTVDWLRKFDEDRHEVRLKQCAGSEAVNQKSEDRPPKTAASNATYNFHSKIETKEIGSSLKPSAAVSDYSFSYESTPDNGMYDALNKGIDFIMGTHEVRSMRNSSEAETQEALGNSPPSNQQAPAPNHHDSIVAWLNCDEQYLPRTLKKVADYFEKHPDVDFVYGNTLLVDAQGTLVSCRKNPPLRKLYVESDHLYTQSASMFFRSKIFEQGFRFDTDWKAVSDCDFVLQLLARGFKTGRIDGYLSSFTMTGDNLSANDIGWSELEKWRSKTPRILRLMSLPFRGARCLEKVVLGGFNQRFPLDYAIYAGDDLEDRASFRANSGTTRFVSWSR